MKLMSKAGFKAGAVALGAAALLGACSGGGKATDRSDSTSDRPDSNSVAVDGIAYDPPTLEVEAGASVTWTNSDVVQHTVTSGRQAEQGVPGVSKGKDAKPDGSFDGALEGEGATFSFAFDEPGRYPYYCEIHVGMVGEIVVK